MGSQRIVILPLSPQSVTGPGALNSIVCSYRSGFSASKKAPSQSDAHHLGASKLRTAPCIDLHAREHLYTEFTVRVSPPRRNQTCLKSRKILLQVLESIELRLLQSGVELMYIKTNSK